MNVNCIHASATSRPTIVRCNLGLFGGDPHVAMCEGCDSRKSPPQPAIPTRVALPRQSDLPPGVAMHAPHSHKPAVPPTTEEKSAATLPPMTPASKSGLETLLLRMRLSPGDAVVMTAAVRDLQKAHPGRFSVAVDTTAPELWENSPHIVSASPNESRMRVIDMQYPLVHESNQRPYHFLHGYVQYLESQLNLRIPPTEFKGDIHLSEQEKQWTNQIEETFGYKGPFWIMLAGGKYDFTAKWWSPDSYQKVVDHFAGRLQFVQCGEKNHWHPELSGVFNLVGKTSIRQFIRLVYHAAGVLCPVTMAMHLAAAVPTKTRQLRPCVVIAGGREPPHWEAYPGHQFLHTIGTLPCCANGGCWKSRCQLVGDHDHKDRHNLCERPVQVKPDLRIPQCMTMIRPEHVIAAIERFSNFA